LNWRHVFCGLYQTDVIVGKYGIFENFERHDLDDYRLVFNNTDIALTNLPNHRQQGPLI